MVDGTNFTTITPVKSSSSSVTNNHDGFVEIHSDDSQTVQPIQFDRSNTNVTASQTSLPQTGIFEHTSSFAIGGECLLMLVLFGILSRRFYKNKWKVG